MSPDACISTHNEPKCVWRPRSARTRWGASQRSPRHPSWIQGVPLLRGRDGEYASNFVPRIGGIEAPEAIHAVLGNRSALGVIIS